MINMLLPRVQEVLQERLLRDRRRAAARAEHLEEQQEKMRVKLEEDKEAVRNLKELIRNENENQDEWAAALSLLDTDLATLATYYQADEGKIRGLSLRLVSLREKVGVARKELQEAATRSRMAHLALDKNAEEFREAHAARQEVDLVSFSCSHIFFDFISSFVHRLSGSGKQASSCSARETKSLRPPRPRLIACEASSLEGRSICRSSRTS